jgi:GNAT superfamily N-acetyltransferase
VGQDSDLTIRRADGPADMEAIYAFLAARETLRAPLDPRKAKTGIATTIREGLAFIVERDGAIIGTVGLFRADWWFSTESAFFSKWFHIAAEERGQAVAAALIEELYDLCEAEHESVFIHVIRPAAAGKFCARAVDEYALFPSGRVAAIQPKTEG